MIELRHLQTLSALRDCETLLDAADRLCVTQSALSHQIKDLEARLQTGLFVRKTRPVRFTDAGKRLLQLADELLPKVAQAEKDIRSMVQGDAGRLAMAIECHSCFNWLMPTVDAYRNLWPGIDLDFSSGFTFEPLPALQAGEIDMVVTSDPQPLKDIIYTPVFGYEMLVALPQDHPLVGREYLQPEDFKDQILIAYPVEPRRLDIYSKFLSPAGITPAQVRHAELTVMMVQLVVSNRGICALPNWVLTEYLEKNLVVARPVGEAGLWSTLYLAYRRDSANEKYLLDFIQQAKTHCFSHLSGIRSVDKSDELTLS